MLLPLSSATNLRLIILLVLVFQTTVTVLLLRYSRIASELLLSQLELDDDDENNNNRDIINDGKTKDLYNGSVAVLSVEILKYLLCIIILIIQHKCKIVESYRIYLREVLWNPKETFKLLVPAGLYTVQNNLLYIALTNLDVATYQVTYQLKILTTSLFSVLILGKKLRCMQWIAMIILTIGVALVQIPEDVEDEVDEEDVESSGLSRSRWIGLISVLSACLSSAFAGVYYEKLVKTGGQKSVVIRNLQLGIFSLIFAVIGARLEYQYSDNSLDHNYFHGFTGIVWIVVTFQAIGGLVVAVVIKYTDNIQKSFASSISIILCSVSSYLILDDSVLGFYFFLGTALVFIATFMYNFIPQNASDSSNSCKSMI